MNNLCDVCKRPCAGLGFSGLNENGEREERRICFHCLADRARVGFTLTNIDRVDEDNAELPNTEEGVK